VNCRIVYDKFHVLQHANKSHRGSAEGRIRRSNCNQRLQELTRPQEDSAANSRNHE
jgi:hypothetical protein